MENGEILEMLLKKFFVSFSCLGKISAAFICLLDISMIYMQEILASIDGICLRAEKSIFRELSAVVGVVISQCRRFDDLLSATPRRDL